jgi:hypothetical protein
MEHEHKRFLSSSPFQIRHHEFEVRLVRCDAVCEIDLLLTLMFTSVYNMILPSKT